MEIYPPGAGTLACGLGGAGIAYSQGIPPDFYSPHVNVGPPCSTTATTSPHCMMSPHLSAISVSMPISVFPPFLPV